MIHLILVKIFRLRFYCIHSMDQHGHKLTWYVYSYEKPNFSQKDEYMVYDWTDYA